MPLHANVGTFKWIRIQIDEDPRSRIHKDFLAYLEGDIFSLVEWQSLYHHWKKLFEMKIFLFQQTPFFIHYTFSYSVT